MTDEHLISLQPGTVIGGKYEIIKCLGAGSMGMVYACRHRQLQGQMVAAKVLYHEVAADEVAAERFKNEVLASYGVSHPNVVRAYDYIRDGDLVAYTMEFVGGGDLAHKLDRAELMSVSEFIRLLSQMTAGVQAIHDAGIVHRDLKPENILLTQDGTVKIGDFGIARKRNGPKLTEYGGVVGTIEYVAPEYLLRSQVDWRSDIYALGVLAYDMLTGESPFSGDNAYASISKRLETDPEPPSAFRDDCPPEIDAIVLKALRRDPEERYQSALEIFSDLQKVGTALGISDATGGSLSTPTSGSRAGERYVGPTLSDGGDSADAPVETQVLTSEGSIDIGAPLVSEPHGARSSRARIHGRSESGSRNVAESQFRSTGDTEVLSPNEVSASVLSSEAEQVTAPAEPFSNRRESGFRTRDDLRSRRAKAVRTTEFPIDLMEESSQRLRVLDMLTFVVAIFVGIGCGFVFLRMFAPSFLERLTLFGIGS